jgi:hypothetical protein
MRDTVLAETPAARATMASVTACGAFPVLSDLALPSVDNFLVVRI